MRIGFSLGFVALLAVGCSHARPPPAAPSHVTAEVPALTSGIVSGELAEVVRSIRPVVVSVTATQTARVPETSVSSAPTASPRRYVTLRHESAGAGFVLDEAGRVVTSAHLVAGASLIRVELWDERQVTARIVGLDPLLDLAVLAVEDPSPKTPHAVLGSSASLEVGEPVIALGNPYGFKQTVTTGILSATHRVTDGSLDDLLQTDAPINPGNSGGPLFDRAGQVVGIITSIALQGQGIGFAIPIDAFREVLPELLAKGHVERGRLGVELQSVDRHLARALALGSTAGALVSAVETHGAQERPGLRRGDLIVAVEGTAVRDARHLDHLVARRAPGSRVTLQVVREGKAVIVTEELAELEVDEDLPPSPEVPSPVGWGVALADERGFVVVHDVAAGSSVEGRLERGDRILEIDRATVKTAGEVERRWSGPGSHVLWVERDGVRRFVGLNR